MRRIILVICYLALTAVLSASIPSQFGFWLYIPFVATSPPIVGMSWHNPEPGDRSALGFDWYYNYGIVPNRSGNDGAEFIPYLWCNHWPAWNYLEHYDYIDEGRQHISAQYDGWLLFLNEPDLPGAEIDGGQCGMSPQQAAYFYKALVTLWPDAQWVGPGVSHQDYYRGWPWLTNWYDEIAKLGVPPPARGAIHTYLTGDPNLIVDSYQDVVRPYSGPEMVWVTEFGHCDPQQAGWMIATWQARGDVERYAWYTTRRGGACTDLFDGPAITALGEVWAQEHRR